MRVIDNKRLRRELERVGMGFAMLVKADGYFYWVSRDSSEHLELDRVPSVYVNSYYEYSENEWVENLLDEYKKLV